MGGTDLPEESSAMPIRLYCTRESLRGSSKTSCRWVAKMPAHPARSKCSRIAPARDAPSLEEVPLPTHNENQFVYTVAGYARMPVKEDRRIKGRIIDREIHAHTQDTYTQGEMDGQRKGDAKELVDAHRARRS